jgi:hypothetical protein
VSIAYGVVVDLLSQFADDAFIVTTNVLRVHNTLFPGFKPSGVSDRDKNESVHIPVFVRRQPGLGTMLEFDVER